MYFRVALVLSPKGCPVCRSHASPARDHDGAARGCHWVRGFFGGLLNGMLCVGMARPMRVLLPRALPVKTLSRAADAESQILDV
jgi:hypothetical protein